MKKALDEFRAIATELQSMAELDQAMRNRCTDDLDGWDETVDYRNTERMKYIVDEIGWPSVSKVGHEGAANAWLIIQHADHDLEFQKQCLALIKSEPVGEVAKRDIAYLEDRIAIAEGRLQIYGTQFHMNSDGQLEPLPIQDPGNVDNRRQEMGLETLSENQRRIQELYGKNSA